MKTSTNRRMALWEYVQRAMALVLILPAIGLVLPAGILIRFSSRGPLLIRQVREGRGGVRFRMFKLRTMVENADVVLEQHLAGDGAMREEWNQYGRLAEDPRIAGWGARLARRFSIDELPQLLNVVSGQMNLIGPRPLPLGVVERLAADDRALRQTVLPGITGLWQVSGRSELTLNEIGRFDRIYVNTRSISHDLAILGRTVRAVVRGEGAY